MNILKDVFGLNLNIFDKPVTRNIPDLTPEEIAKSPKPAIAPARTSDPGPEYGSTYNFDTDKWLVRPGYQFEVIPLIRRLSIGNQSVSQALANIVNLANTGHRVVFNSAVDPVQVDKMRAHLDRVVPLWQYGITGRHGLRNKLISQAMISGATCSEVVVNKKFTGVYRFLMPHPETIRFIYNRSTITYEPYQRSRSFEAASENILEFGLKKLNPNSFKYFPINGDTEQPYGNPPYLPAISPLEDQKVMLQNIKFIIQQIGIMGFWEVMVEKPEQADLEGIKGYKGRVDSYLQEVKDNMKQSFKDGILVGLKDEHEFKFNTATASASGVAELFSQNENLLNMGLKQDSSLMNGGTSQEGNMTVVFTKLLAEIKNCTDSADAALKFAYELELRLAGFSFDSITIEPAASTIQDDLKVQQGQEIKIRNKRQLRMDGIISQDQYADELGYEKPYQQEPIVPFEPAKVDGAGNPSIDAQKKKKRETAKDASDRKVRDKNKPQGTVKK